MVRQFSRYRPNCLKGKLYQAQSTLTTSRRYEWSRPSLARDASAPNNPHVEQFRRCRRLDAGANTTRTVCYHFCYPTTRDQCGWRTTSGTGLLENPYKQGLSDTARYENGRHSPNYKTAALPLSYAGCRARLFNGEKCDNQRTVCCRRRGLMGFETGADAPLKGVREKRRPLGPPFSSSIEPNYWQRCRRPSGPLNVVPGAQARPLWAA
jgi:hypothetical protein